jgi:predicted enzyme related to lactoylglutathione lyase
MSSRTSPWPVGTPCWVEVAADDPEAVMAFYAAVLGWTYTDGVAPHHAATALLDGRPVAGIGTTGAEADPAWTLYLAVDDADAAADRSAELGAMLLHGPEDAGDAGRLFVALDVGGAVFAGWEHEAHVGVGVVDEPGALCWVSSASAEPGASRTFYRRLFGYEYVETAEAGSATFHGAGGPALGSIGSAGDALPHWLVHFGVADVDATVDAARDAGGTLVAPHPGGAVLADPAGASFGVRVLT